MYTAAGTLDVEQRVAEHAPLVRRMAHHLAAKLPASVDLDDIIQAGMIGLMDAAARYEESQGTQFETYASQRIKGAMLDELRQNDWLPRSMRKSLRKVEGAVAKLEQRLGRAPTEGELAKELNVSLAEYQTLLQEARGYTLLYVDDFDADGEDGYLERHCPDERELNFKEIAAVLEVSESRVCQLHGQAVARLRARLRDW
jgi:RNA polymerase sigma factor for flagellar operon FliA